MPFTLSTAPSRIKALPKHAKEIWIATFNSAWKQHSGDEVRSNKIAWGAVKKQYKKSESGKWSKLSGHATASSLDPSGSTTSRTFAGKKKKKSKSNGGRIKMKMAKFTKWSTKYKTNLPDSAFAVVLDGKEGTKVRKLPYKDESGKVDIPHLRNALVRVAQGKAGLSGAARAQAKNNLHLTANKYLQTNKDTASGQIMGQFISKFKDEPLEKISGIITLLRDKATNKKPTDLVDIDVKTVSLMISQLEEIAEYEKAKLDAEKVAKSKDEDKKESKKEEESKEKKEDSKEEDKDEKKEEKKEQKDESESKESDEKKEEKESASDKESKEEDKAEEETESDKFDDKAEDKKEEKKESEESAAEDKDEKKEEKKDGEEGESKFKQLLEVCEGYKKELEVSQSLVSKFKEEIEGLKENNSTLNTQVSKFKEEEYEKLLDTTVAKVSKFKSLSNKEALDLKKEYLTSKMSDSALEEIGRMAEDQIVSKFGNVPKIMTRPSQELVGGPERTAEDLMSKMSNREKLRALSHIQARQGGYVSPK